jgi:dihydrofolate reductase
LLLGRKTYEIFAGSWGVWDENADGFQGELIRTLAERDLVDEYRLAVYPLVLGTGKKLFPDGFALTRLTLAGSIALSSGVVVNTYRRPDAG